MAITLHNNRKVKKKEAVEMVNSKQMSYRCIMYTISHGVLCTAISDNKNKVSKTNKIGRPPIISRFQ